MYTLQKAKEEIDTVAKHATDIAVHTLAIADNFDAKLASLKKEIARLIEAKFDELSKTLLGDTQNFETSAVADLGAKVAQLIQVAAPPSVHGITGADPAAPVPPPGSEHQTGEHGQHNNGYNQHP